jgi:hypothetical protein
MVVLKRFPAIAAAIIVLTLEAQAQGADVRYPKLATIDQYLMAQDAEADMAKTAAPDSISKDADVLVLDRQGYRTFIKGRNGFVCMVLRSWTASFDDPEFWSQKLRGPICFNPPAVRSYLPVVFKRTKLALAGKTREQLAAEMKASFEAKEIPAIENGAIGYMQSKLGFLGDQNGHWHPHLMFYVAQMESAAWGANLPGSPIFGSPDPAEHLSIFIIPVPKWSDGSPDGGSH